MGLLSERFKLNSTFLIIISIINVRFSLILHCLLIHLQALTKTSAYVYVHEHVLSVSQDHYNSFWVPTQYQLSAYNVKLQLWLGSSLFSSVKFKTSKCQHFVNLMTVILNLK